MSLRARMLFVTPAVAALTIMAATDVAAAGRGNSGSRVLTFCDGGAQEAVFTNTQTTQTSITTNAFVPIASTAVPGGGSGAAGDSDTYTVTFSGEAGATGGGNWEIAAQVSVNGGAFVNIDPAEAMVFHTNNPRQTHSMTWCKRIEASSTTFQVLWRKVGGGTAIVDDYLIQVERSN